MSKHTPGPWIHLSAYGGGFLVRTSDLFNAIAAPNEHGPIKSEANARLIAAAPDLLEALKAMLSHTADLDPMQGYRPEEDFSAVKQACAAIARAEGEPK